MNIIPLPAPSPDVPPEIARQARRLEEMIEAGMEMMRLVLQQAHASAQAASSDSANPGKPRDFTVAFSRITTGIRQAMTMANALKQEPVAAKAPVAKAPVAKAKAQGDDTLGRMRDLGVRSSSNPPEHQEPGVREEKSVRPADPPDHHQRREATDAVFAEALPLPVIANVDQQDISVIGAGLTPARHPG